MTPKPLISVPPAGKYWRQDRDGSSWPLEIHEDGTCTWRGLRWPPSFVREAVRERRLFDDRPREPERPAPEQHLPDDVGV